MREHLARALALGVVTLDDGSPQKTCGAELGDLHEVRRRYGKRETDLACSLVNRKVRLGKLHQIVVCCRKREGQLLDDGRTGVAEGAARDVHHADALIIGRTLDELHDLREAVLALGVAAAEVALGREVLHDGIDAEVDVYIILLQSHGLDLVNNKTCDLAHLLTREGDLDGRKIDILQQRLEILGCELLRGDVETDSIHAGIEDLQGLGIGLGGRVYRQGLMYAPIIAVARTPHIGELAGLRSEELDALQILGPVIWTHVESFGGSPHELALIVGPF